MATSDNVTIAFAEEIMENIQRLVAEKSTEATASAEATFAAAQQQA